MKVRHVELPEIDEDQCEHCALHRTVAAEHKDKVECAWCGEWTDVTFIDLETVGESNTDHDDEEITHTYVWECTQCHKHTALMPTKVIWNANHDTYYTGGQHYIPGISGDLQLDKGIEDKIENYTSRILAGEDSLRPWNLRVWIQYAIEEGIAKCLYAAGYKR